MLWVTTAPVSVKKRISTRAGSTLLGFSIEMRVEKNAPVAPSAR